MKSFLAFRHLFVAALLTLAFAGVAPAQTNEGQLAGNVLDSTGAQVANARVSAKNEATGSTYNVVSTSAGSYRFPSIDLGRYTVSATAKGFSSSVNTGVEVRVGSITGFDIRLAVGGATDTVTVAADAPTIETQSSDVGGTVTTRQIVDLPLALGGVGAMRSPEAFIFLVPGTAGPGTGNSNNGIFISKIGGGQNFGNEVLIDGASQTRSENGSSYDEEAPSVEAISEFKVTTNTPAAEFGRTTGGIENFVTKSGTNSYHGTAFDIFRNEDLNANNWFNNGFRAIRRSVGDSVGAASFNTPTNKQNDFGGSFGGPITIPHIYHGKDKSFFFFAWEQFRQNFGGVSTSDVPTVADRGGNFQPRLGNQLKDSNGIPILNPCDGQPIFAGEIYDPLTEKSVNVNGATVRCRSAFPNNTIPQARFSTVAKNIIAYFPTPTNNQLNQNFTLSSGTPLTNTTYTVRIDQTVTDKNKIWATYNTRENTRNSPPFLTLPYPVDPNRQTQDFITHFVRVGWDYVITPNVLNHVVFGFNRSNSINGSQAADTGINFAQQLGIGNITTGFPRINVSGYVPLSRNQKDDNVDNGGRFNDSVSYQRGRNSFKIGFDYRYQQYSSISNGGLNGNFNFNGNQTKASDVGVFQNGTGNGFASLLLGSADFGGASVPFHQARWISNYWAGFIQDDLKVSNSLVLNLGIRYDVDQPRREAANDTSNFSLTAIDPKNGLPGALVFASNCNTCNKRWADTYYKDFAPRVGFAYTPPWLSGKTVVRGGFSTLYGPLQYSDFGGSTRQGYTANPSFGSNGFNPAFQIDGGLPAYQTSVNLDPGQLDNGNADGPISFSGFIKASYGRPPQINQWNIQVQQELAKDLILTIGYIGSAGSHLRSGIENINNAPKSSFVLGDILTQHNLALAGVTKPYTAFNGQIQQALRPFPQYGFIATDCCLQNVGHSSYEALIASVERRFSKGLNLQASYTWAKSITNADSSLPGITAGVNQEQDPFDSKSQKAISIQDIPHTFVVSYIYELPFGRDRKFLNHGFLGTVFGGFQIGAVQRYQSGEPISFGCADGIPGWDNCISFTRIPGSSLASHVKNIDPFRQAKILLNPNAKVFGPDPKVDSIFNGLLRPDQQGVDPSSGAPLYGALQPNPAFISQNAPVNRSLRATAPGQNGDFRFGNVPRVTGEVRNFQYYNEDFAFIKKTPITERLKFIFKVELLNAFNRHIFGSPDTQPYDNGFGVPTFTIDTPRQMQLTARIEF